MYTEMIETNNIDEEIKNLLEHIEEIKSNVDIYSIFVDEQVLVESV